MITYMKLFTTYLILCNICSFHFSFALVPVQLVELGTDQHISSQSKPKLVTLLTNSTALMVYKKLCVALNLEIYRNEITECSIICQFLEQFFHVWWYLLIRQTLGRLISDWAIPITACSNWFLNFAGFNYRLSDTSSLGSIFEKFSC